MPIFRKKDSPQYWDQAESEFDVAAAVTVWLTWSIVALILGFLAWFAQDYVWTNLGQFTG
jgi:hypothetical protein